MIRGTDFSDFLKPLASVYKAYHRGKVLSKVKLHAQEMKLASIGSPLALDNTRKNLLDMEDDE